MRSKSIILGLLLLAAAPAKALSIFACEPIYGQLAKELAPDAKIYNATNNLQDPHYVEARPSLISKLRRADVAICGGASLELAWLPMLQLKAGNRDMLDGEQGMFYAADYVDTVDQLDRVTADMGDVHAEGNPHFHLDPHRLIKIAKAFAQRLTEIDGDNGYTANALKFEQSILAAEQAWQPKIKYLKGVNVAAYHSDYRYLYMYLGMEKIADLEPVPGVPPSNAHLGKLIKKLTQQPIGAVVLSKHHSVDAGQWLSSKLNKPLVVLSMNPEGEQTLAQWLTDNITKLADSVDVR
ncbi:metal ABC transporter solute-binding protein, Zn/Mn family [Paraferrimonas sp. SM1919]|uniref:metal ABC transporter solute-binding protein, Zn/Mn family n=1 Tax=Paraferrimonas sp. SM1919 TaxID=2662263 RepID=UPI0013D5D13F|nr:zinc ABC transporter substrate-binding protein [Paraferrimonas sp. SM1919]